MERAKEPGPWNTLMRPGKNNVVWKLGIIKLYLSCDQKDFEEEIILALEINSQSYSLEKSLDEIFLEKISYR